MGASHRYSVTRAMVHLPSAYHGSRPLHLPFVVREHKFHGGGQGFEVRLRDVGGLLVLDERIVELSGAADERQLGNGEEVEGQYDFSVAFGNGVRDSCSLVRVDVARATESEPALTLPG